MRKALHRLVMATGELAVEDRGEHANSPDPNVALGNDQMGPAGSPAITQWHLEAHRRKVIRNAQARTVRCYRNTLRDQRGFRDHGRDTPPHPVPHLLDAQLSYAAYPARSVT